MQIHKFGGASIKDADGVRNLVKVIDSIGTKDSLIVVSAMGKTTNALEKVVGNFFDNKKELKSSLQEVKKFHNAILLDLFESAQTEREHEVFSVIGRLFEELEYFLDHNRSPDYNFVYDQVVGYGELISTKIISTYLNNVGINNHWVDVRNLIKTDNYYRHARVDWDRTTRNINNRVVKDQLNIIQGFLGSDSNNFTTTLGREGSDYTAAIFAYALGAKKVTIWKDVPGVLSADPRYFENAKLINCISYREAIELAFYGASVIHPKTLQPLQRKEIPLFVKSFLEPESEGTRVGKGIKIEPEIPCYIVKKQQVLISLSSLDFSYIVEDNISYIFSLLSKYKMKVDVIQNSAISFSVCVDDLYGRLDELLLMLKAKFKVECIKEVSLYTIRHYNQEAIESIENEKTVLLKQLTPETVQIVTK
ncbi:MAG: aspartate kinase [Flavobacteriaceae bacterium]|nr:aspartate kinase [Bacteroidia bacterium]NNK71398.1 aspartate kinase [Flavobacteriaceae bacterium]